MKKLTILAIHKRTKIWKQMKKVDKKDRMKKELTLGQEPTLNQNSLTHNS